MASQYSFPQYVQFPLYYSCVLSSLCSRDVVKRRFHFSCLPLLRILHLLILTPIYSDPLIPYLSRAHINVDTDVATTPKNAFGGNRSNSCSCDVTCGSGCMNHSPYHAQSPYPGDMLQDAPSMDGYESGALLSSSSLTASGPVPQIGEPWHNEFPFLHPSDPTTYSTLPTTLADYSNANVGQDTNFFFSGGNSRLGSMDWNAFSSPAPPPFNFPEVASPMAPQATASPKVLSPSDFGQGSVAMMASPTFVSSDSNTSSNTTPSAHSCQHHSSPAPATNIPVRNYDGAVMSVDLTHTLLNRLQWYQVTCKLRDKEGRPILINQLVNLDDSVAFVDGRRRQDNAEPHPLPESGISITAIVTCASTGKKLDKCKKCVEKDKSLRKRKRKRDEDVLWSEQDEENNNKLVQLYSTGTEQFNEDGDLKVKLRIGCCVGVTKQHHLNHVVVDPESCQETLDIHRTCDGVLLTLIVNIDSKLLPGSGRAPPGVCQLTATMHSPIRILGKVTEAERQKQSNKDEDDEHLSPDEAPTPELSVLGATANGSSDRSTPQYLDMGVYSQFAPSKASPEETKPVLTDSSEIGALRTLPMGPVVALPTADESESTGDQVSKRIIKSSPSKPSSNEPEHVLPSNPSAQAEYANAVPGRQWSTDLPADIEEMGFSKETRRHFKGCSSCAARGDRELFTSVTPVKLRPSIILNHFKTKYRAVFERVIPGQILQDMSRDTNRFFAEPPFESFSANSPSMLQVYTVLAVGACISGYMDSAEKFWAHAIRLAQTLIVSPVSGAKDTTLLADGLNRISYYFGSGGDAATGAYFNNQAIKCLQQLATSHKDRVFSLPVYETALWSCVTYHLDRQTIEEAHAWAVGQNNTDMRCYTLFLKVMTTCMPDLKDFVSSICRLDSLHNFTGPSLASLHPYTNFVSPTAMNTDLQADQLQQEAYNALVTLRQLYQQNSTFSPANAWQYEQLADTGFQAMESWFKGERQTAAALAKLAAIQASLIEVPQFPALIPTYFACFICCFEAEDAALQLKQPTGSSSFSPFGDYTELLIKAFTRVSHYRWIRPLVDYFVQRLSLSLGRQLELHTCPLREGSAFDPNVV